MSLMPTGQQPKVIRVMGFGTFDGLHQGHLSYFEQLKALGNELYLIVARNTSIIKLKGRPPLLDENERLAILKKIPLIDHVILGNENNFHQVISDYNPDIIGLGYDQGADIEKIKEEFPTIDIMRLKPLDPTTYKSSLLSALEIESQKKGILPF